MPMGWQLGKMFTRNEPLREASEAKQGTIRLMEIPRRAPETPIESEIAAVLRDGEISYQRLVRRVAELLYRDELRRGAGASDIGLFGSCLFDGDVTAALEAGADVLWEISWDGE
jgi:hypothetical protein